MKKAALAFCLVFLLLLASCATKGSTTRLEDLTVGIAWRQDTSSRFYTQVVDALEKCGVKTILLEKVESSSFPYDKKGELDWDAQGFAMDLGEEITEDLLTYGYLHSNAEEVLADVDLIVFTGGEDLSPSLYGSLPDLEADILELYNATRDASDYLTLDYAVKNGIPVLGICRGMQLLAVYSGVPLIEDIGAWYEENGKEYTFLHRMKEKEGRNYTPHDVEIVEEDSLLGKAVQGTILPGVPSWHHQGVGLDLPENLMVTAVFCDQGLTLAEGVERKDIPAVGIQFHPEYVLYAEGPEGFLGYEEAKGLFTSLILSLVEK